MHLLALLDQGEEPCSPAIHFLPWLTGAQLDLPTRHHSGANGYSKTSKRGQVIVHLEYTTSSFSGCLLCCFAALESEPYMSAESQAQVQGGNAAVQYHRVVPISIFVVHMPWVRLKPCTSSFIKPSCGAVTSQLATSCSSSNTSSC